MRRADPKKELTWCVIITSPPLAFGRAPEHELDFYESEAEALKAGEDATDDAPDTDVFVCHVKYQRGARP